MLDGPIARGDLDGLCGRALILLEAAEACPVVCDVRALRRPDAVTVDALARLQLVARRLGRRFRLRDACAELQELLRLTGLCETLPCEGRSALESCREAEERKQTRRVQEEDDPADPAP